MKTKITRLSLLLTAFLVALMLSAQSRGRDWKEQEVLRDSYGYVLSKAVGVFADQLAEEVSTRSKQDVIGNALLYEPIVRVESEGLTICRVQISWIDRPSKQEFIVWGRLYLYDIDCPSNHRNDAYMLQLHYDTANDEVWKYVSKRYLEKLTTSKVYYLDVRHFQYSED